MRKKRRGSYDYCTDTTSNRITVCWFVNKTVTFVSSFAGIELLNSVRCFDRKVQQYIMVEQSYVVKIYNKHMGRYDVLFLHVKHERSYMVYLHMGLHTSYCFAKRMIFVPPQNLLTQQNVAVENVSD